MPSDWIAFLKTALVLSAGLCCHALVSFSKDLSDAPLAEVLDLDRLQKAISSGRVFQHANFLAEDQVKFVLNEIADFEVSGLFERKGLSNTATMKNQTFSYQDRSVCVVPWFVRALEGKEQRDIPRLISQLHRTLATVLDRPSMLDTNLSHECYYSKSEIGSSLARHMDERHEELKGAKGWLLPSRRSLSWLVYLSDENWDLTTNGGALRTFPQQGLAGNNPTHEGNLLVGWLLPESTQESPDPVYLDSWYPVVGVEAVGQTNHEYHCVLYILNDDTGRKKIITRPWLNDNLQGMSTASFIQGWAREDSKDGTATLFVDSKFARQFRLIEDRPAWESGKNPDGSFVEDIAPQRGSLVVFDSVILPHQVERITAGTRVALAGWFHEATQSFPESLMG